jgi:hypothetical protein
MVGAVYIHCHAVRVDGALHMSVGLRAPSISSFADSSSLAAASTSGFTAAFPTVVTVALTAGQ